MEEKLSFTQRLIFAQQAIGTLNRDATNPHFKSRYVTLDHLLEASRPALGAHGLLLSQHLTANDTIITRISDGTDELTSEVRICSGGTQNPQQYGSAVTYARRYALTALLAISTDADDDGELVAANTTARTVEQLAQAAPLKAVKAAAPLSNAIEKARDAGIVKHAASFDQDLAARIIAAGEVACNFGKMKNTKLRDMEPNLVTWWENRVLKANPNTNALNEDDVTFKIAAALWNRGLVHPELLNGYIESAHDESPHANPDLDLADYHDDDIYY